MVAVGLLAIEELDLQTAANSCWSGSASSGSLDIDEFEVSGAESDFTDANGEAIFCLDGIKDESFIKGEVDNGTSWINRR